jgi:DNA (cytosine-5)-methyltransferase 1
MRVVSLFSGAGGLDLGLVQAGHKIVWANDVFLDAVDTYRKNIGGHVDTRDICEIPVADIPECDVVVGGFPCQGFSVANWERQINDPRNQLYKHFVRVVREKTPKYFIAENVKGLKSMENGAVLLKILEEFEACGYRVQHTVVNAADYNTPQSRKRVLIFGVRSDLSHIVNLPPTPTHSDPSLAEKLGLRPWITVGEALAHFPEPEEGTHIPNHECSKYKLRFNGYLGHRFIKPDKPAPTVTGRGDDRGGVVVLHHPRNHRRMTVRELAAVQSFPDDFVFSGCKSSAYRQVANAVPPALGFAIGKMLLNGMDKTS